MNPAAVELAARDIVAIGLRDCGDILAGRLVMDDAAALGERGYDPPYADPDGRWALRRIDAGEVRIGGAPSKPGCHLSFEGLQAKAIYEAAVAALRDRGFDFVRGRRARPERAFVLDTLTTAEGRIAIVTMFRPEVPEATMFAITFFPNQ